MLWNAFRLPFAASTLALITVAAAADDFHGFNPTNFNGEMLSAATLKAAVADAAKITPPKNGKNYVFAFANLDRGITFCNKVESGIKANAEAAGVDLSIADNHLDGATALANAESFINRNVDYVIEFQTDANFGATIMQKMDDAKIKVTAIDIPMGNATFFGVNNPRAGYMGGSYLAQAAIAKWAPTRSSKAISSRANCRSPAQYRKCAPTPRSPASSPPCRAFPPITF